MQANFVTAIVRNDNDEILMVLVKADDMPEPLWNLPGGRVEKGETAHQAVIRETYEETGILIKEVGELAYEVRMQFDDQTTLAKIFTVKSWSGILSPHDPDDKILRANWMAREQAIALLGLWEYPPMVEPPIAYLSGQARQGQHWQYRVSGEVAIWVHNADD